MSVLWAMAPRAVAEQVEAAHAAAVADALAWLEDNACFTRLSTDGVRQQGVGKVALRAGDLRRRGA